MTTRVPKMGIDISLGVMALLLTAPAAAQAIDEGEQPSSGDIVVTAQKREQTLLQVPLSVTAITGEDIVRRGASSIEDLQYAVPGLSISEFSPGQQRVQLRGLSVYSGLPTVGVYQDELPLNTELNQTGQDVRLLDIDRIEVLRGPQGTLYGQGAIGGTIRYITNDVDLSRYSVSASGQVAGVHGGGADWRTEAVANVPLVSERFGARVAASYQHFGGWFDNPMLGQTDVNSGHAATVRGKLAARLTDDLKVTLTGQYQDLQLGAQNVGDANGRVFGRAPTPYSSKAVLLNAVVTYDFGFASLLSSTGYSDRRDQINTDYTDVLRAYVAPIGGVAPESITSIAYRERPRSKIFTQEVRLSSSGDQPLNWTIGGFYRDSVARTSYATTVTPNIIPAGYILLSADGTNPVDSRSWAIFGEGSYKLASNVTALVGLRYFSDERTQLVTSSSFNSTKTDAAKGTFHALSPRFNLSWQPTDTTNIYANIARGFRSGGFNQTSSGAGLGVVPPTFRPDTVWTYELGGKLQSSDRRFSAELAGYRNVWNNVQTTTNVAGLPISYTGNGGKMTGWGIDGSLNFLPVPALTVSLTGGWNSMAYRTSSAEHLAGDRADYVPRFTGSASAEYRLTVADLPSFVRVDFQHSAPFRIYLRNFQTSPVFSDEQNILNARIGTSGRNWSAEIFSRNILDRASVSYPSFGSRPYPAPIQPRTVGVGFSVKY